MKDKGIYLGIDVGGTFTKVVLVDARGRLLVKEKVLSEGFADKDLFLKRIKETSLRLFDKERGNGGRVRAVGVGLPGPVDPGRGVVLSLTNIRGWKDFPVVSFLKKAFSVPVFIENDANAMALAEAREGAARGFSCALCLTLGTGVGGGLIINGQIYRSPLFMGGEVGHIPIAPDGPVCVCGGRGCLERYVGNRAIRAAARRLLGRSVTLEELSLLAVRGHRGARRIWTEVGEKVGFAAAGVVNVFNPQVIVVGGGVAAAGDILMDSIRASVRRHAMRQLKAKVRIKRAQLGNDAGVLGAALLAKERIEVPR